MKLYQLVAKKGDTIIASISSEKASDLDYYEKFYKMNAKERLDFIKRACN